MSGSAEALWAAQFLVKEFRGLGCRGLGLILWGLGFRAQGLGFRVQGSVFGAFRAWCEGFRVDLQGSPEQERPTNNPV